jgi:hypothetical protein
MPLDMLPRSISRGIYLCILKVCNSSEGQINKLCGVAEAISRQYKKYRVL